jgi:hypothetical protein
MSLEGFETVTFVIERPKIPPQNGYIHFCFLYLNPCLTNSHCFELTNIHTQNICLLYLASKPQMKHNRPLCVAVQGLIRPTPYTSLK